MEEAKLQMNDDNIQTHNNNDKNRQSHKITIVCASTLAVLVTCVPRYCGGGNNIKMSAVTKD